MAKTLYGHRIGANVHEPDAPQAVKIVPDNKTLIALPFNDEHDEDVDPVRLKSMKEIFAHYQPSREVELKNAEGESDEMVFKFNELKDFTKDGIVAQSEILQDLEEQESVFSKLSDVLQNNMSLRNVLSDDEKKKDFVELLEVLIEELSQTNE